MEKIESSLSKEVSLVRLYREDIKEILELLQKQTALIDVKIETDKYKYSQDEFKDIPTSDILKAIYSHNPFYLNIEFISYFGGGVRIYCEKQTAETLGTVTLIENYLQTKRRRLLSMILSNWFVVPIPGLVVFVTVILKEIGILSTTNVLVIWLITIVIWLSLSFLSLNKRINKNIVSLSSGDKHQSFFTRNRDQIILNLFFTIMGFMLGVILQKYI